MILDRKPCRSHNIPLSLMMIVPFVLQVVGAVGIVGYLSYRTGQDSVNQLATELRTQTVNRVETFLRNYLATPILINRLNADAFNSGQISFQDIPNLEKHLFRQLQQFETVSHILVGNEKGLFRVANRNPAPSLLMSDPLNPARVYDYRVDRKGNKVSIQNVIETSWVKERPWYQAAVKAGAPLHVPIFLLSDNSDFSFNTSYPIYAPDTNKLLGVFSAASDLSFFHKFMAELKIGKSGHVVVMERNGLLVGNSISSISTVRIQKEGKPKLKRLKMDESNEHLIQSTGRYLLTQFNGFEQISAALHLEFWENGERNFVEVVPYKDELGLDWLIVVVVPESDFMSKVQDNTRWTILLCGITTILAIAFGIITARWINKPILQLSRASKAIASGDWQEPLAENNVIAEISTLAKSFNQMKKQVQQSFDRVEFALKESEEKYKVLFQTAPIGISMTDKNGRIVESNIITEGWFGKPQLLSQECQNYEPNPHIIRPDGSPMPIEEYACIRALKSNTTICDVEMGIVCADGVLRWFSVSAAPIPSEQYGVVLIHVDISDRKQAEEALRKSEARFQKIALSLPGVIYVTVQRPDGSSYFEYVSSGVEDLNELSVEQVLQNPCLIYKQYVPDDCDSFNRAITHSIETMSALQHEWRIITPSGKLKWVQVNSRSEQQKNGNINFDKRENGDIARYGIVLDVTARKQAEEALERTVNELNYHIENSPLGTIRWDREFRVSYWSKQAEEIFGWSAKEVLGKHLHEWQFIFEDDREQVIESTSQLLDGVGVICHNRNYHKDGSIIYCEWYNSALVDEFGNLISVLSLAHNISDRKQAEIDLKQSEQTNRAILSAIPDLLLRVRRDGSCLDFIPPLIDQAGTFLPVIKHLSEVLPPDLINLQLQRIAQALATGKLQVWEHQIIKNDQICYEEIRVFPCGVDECLVIVRDISTRKQTELALIEAKATAEAATKAKGEFLASMSHEIRTPMNGVIGMTEILEMTELTTDQQEFVKTIKDSGQALLTIINDILDFSKIESGMLEIESRDFDLEELVRGVCKLLENQVIAKQIDLKYAIAPNIPKTVIGDLARLRQILLNLVGNAVKFTQNGYVSISVSGKRLDGKYELTFAIADTGIGIASDRLDLLFQAFTQADNSISREYGGTGLGLAISKRLVNLMEGTIWVESLGQVGGSPPITWKPQPHNPLTSLGSTFYFTITLLINQTINQPQAALAKELVIDEKFAEKFPLRILLVEDNQVNQMVAKLMLQKLGYQINAIANNGLEAVQAVQNDDYDLILMDVQMPKMDGLTATKMIRQGLKSPVRIVAMTADAMPEDRQACLDAGMDDFISKPISIQALMSIASSTK